METNDVTKHKRLVYKIHQCSSMSSLYAPENILEDKPGDQLSRWSSDTNTPPQFLILKLDKPAIVSSITFGKYEKTHVCNLKRFKVYGGMDEENMIELTDNGLRNDAQPETFALRNTLNSRPFPCQFVKILPIQSWGPSFNFSIWFVALDGDDGADVVQPAIHWHRQFRERETIRLCLKHFRQKNYTEVFDCLLKKTKIQLEHPKLTDLHRCIVTRGDYEVAEQLIQSAIQEGLLDEYINAQQPVPQWTALISPDDTLTEGSSNGSPANQTPLATPGNLTPEAAPEPQVSLDQLINLGGVVHDPRVPHRSSNSSSANTPTAGASPSFDIHPGARGGHQMVLDSGSQIIYLFGGWDGTKDLSDFWAFNIGTGKWRLISIDTKLDGGPSQRSCHKMVIDSENKHIFTLGRYLERGRRDDSENTKSDFFMYDISSNKWTLITDDTSAMGGPALIFDHQMCLDQDKRKIYVFGGQSLYSPANPSSPTSDEAKSSKCYSGLYEYFIPTNSWKKLRDDVSETNTELRTLKSRSSHSMLFHPGLRKLYIFGGQGKNDEYLNDFFTYNVDNDEVAHISCAKGFHSDPSSIPAAGYTQRATIDCNRSEIHVMTGLNFRQNKDKEKMDYPRVSNAFWVYNVVTNKWTCSYRYDNNQQTWSPNGAEPRPRYAHQLVYDDVHHTHFMFGGNPGGKQGKEDKLRLGDFWKLSLIRPDRQEVFRRCSLMIRRSKFLELTFDDGQLPVALEYMRRRLAQVVDHRDKEEEADYQLLASQLFQLPLLDPADGDQAPEEELADKKHALRNDLFEKLAGFFPDHMTHPKATLIDLIPHPSDAH